MAKFSFKITVEAASEEHAKKVAQVVQNMVSNTDAETQSLLHKKILQAPAFFKGLLQNPFVKNFLK